MSGMNLSPAELERACTLLRRLHDSRNALRGERIHVPRTFPPEELDWLAARGLAPNQPRPWTHDERVERVVSARGRLSLEDGARAFVSSLEGAGPPRGVLLEAALLAHRMPSHPFTALGNSNVCRECGLAREGVTDASRDFLDWHSSGTGIPGDLAWAARGVEHLERHEAAQPSAAARARLAATLHVIDGLPADATPMKAVQAVQALGFFHESRSRPHRSQSLVETLGFAGLLEAPPHVGLMTRFVSFRERDERPSVRTEVDSPLGFWRGAHGVQWTHAQALFGLDAREAARRAPTAAREAPVSRPRARPARRSPRGLGLPRREPRAGDLWGVRLREDAWTLVYVWEVAVRGPRPYARVEYLDVFTPEPPDPSAPGTRSVRGRSQGRWQTHVSGLEKTAGCVLLAENRPAPTSPLPAPDHLPGGSAKDLARLADWCFPELRR